ncbi:MAG: hypothetical protein ACR2QT_11750 [Woeseiaceae bacterium]
MWLPAPLYERLPQFWLLVGLLFIAGGAYLGIEYEYTVWYFGIGALSIVWGIVLYIIRSRRKANPTPSEGVEEEQAG